MRHPDVDLVRQVQSEQPLDGLDGLDGLDLIMSRYIRVYPR